MRRLKSTADDDRHSPWGRPVDEIGDVDPASLPLSATLVADPARWAATFDATLSRADPARVGFASAQEASAASAEGERRAARRRDELGAGWESVHVG